MIHKTSIFQTITGFALSLLFTITCFTDTAQAQVSGISYSASPTVEYLFWNRSNAGVKGGALYGAQVGLGFGQYVELSGLYQRSVGVQTDIGQFLDDNTGDLLSERNISFRRLGIETQLNAGRLDIGEVGLLPFLTAGTGILRVQPEDLDEVENIYLNVGLGLMFSVLDRYTLSIQAENLSYRQNAVTAYFTGDELTEAGLIPDDFDLNRVSNYGFRAALSVHLGGRDPDQFSNLDRQLQEQFRAGLRGIRFPIEPFVGQLRFNKAFNFPNRQRLAGLNVGLDFGPYVGLRGFYWRGVSEDQLTSFADLQMYGAEMKFRLNTGQGFVPYLTTGAGYMDLLSDFEIPDGPRPDDQYFAIAGGGLEFALSPAVRLNAGVRSILQSTRDAVDTSKPDNVYGSALYSLGISFGIGGTRPEEPAIVRRSTMQEELDSLRMETAERETRLTKELAALGTTNDSLRAALTNVRAQFSSIGDSLSLMEFDVDSLDEQTTAYSDSVRSRVRQLLAQVDSITTNAETNRNRIDELLHRRDDLAAMTEPRESYEEQDRVQREAGGRTEPQVRTSQQVRSSQNLTSGDVIVLPFSGEGEWTVRYSKPASDTSRTDNQAQTNPTENQTDLGERLSELEARLDELINRLSGVATTEVATTEDD